MVDEIRGASGARAGLEPVRRTSTPEKAERFKTSMLAAVTPPSTKAVAPAEEGEDADPEPIKMKAPTLVASGTSGNTGAPAAAAPAAAPSGGPGPSGAA